jgi:hypothetical protein
VEERRKKVDIAVPHIDLEEAVVVARIDQIGDDLEGQNATL